MPPAPHHAAPRPPRVPDPRHTAGIGRRAFITGTATAAAAAGFASMAHADPAGERRTPPQRARNLILCVSDGMSIGAHTIADHVSRLRTGERTHWSRHMQRPDVVHALVMTHSANSPVTDSAAAASAWGTGVLCNNGAINVDAQGRAWEPLFVRAMHAGKRAGLVSTARLSHATPAGMIANNASRGNESEIARQTLERAPAVLLGGGGRFFTEQLLAEFGHEGNVARSARELEQRAHAPARGPLIGIFNDDHMAYELDRDETDEPSLAQMTRAAIDRLGRPGDDAGFVLQVEAARVDHAAHACDIAGIVGDQLAFDAAVAEALAFAADRDDTLVLITTDHGNAGPNLTVYHDAAEEGVARIERARRSFQWMFGNLYDGDPDAPDHDELPDLVAQATGVELGRDEFATLRRAIAGEAVNASELMRSPHHVLGSLLSNHFGVNFVSGNHTSEHVIQTAYGPGSQLFAGLMHLTDTHDRMVHALGLSGARVLAEASASTLHP